MRTRIRNNEISEYVKNLQPFKAHTTTGVLVKSRREHVPIGRLTAPYIPPFDQALGRISEEDESTALYIVYSYETPIAWCQFGIWTMPVVKYSQTTSCAQGRVRVGANLPSPAPVPRKRRTKKATPPTPAVNPVEPTDWWMA